VKEGRYRLKQASEVQMRELKLCSTGPPPYIRAEPVLLAALCWTGITPARAGHDSGHESRVLHGRRLEVLRIRAVAICLPLLAAVVPFLA